MTQRKIIVSAHDRNFKTKFKRLAADIKTILADNCIAVYHIGSTAIDDLVAKPTIDVMPVVYDILQVDKKEKSLCGLGLTAKGEFGMPFRRFFQKDEGTVRLANIHIFEKSNPEIERHLLFIDYLKKHSSEKKAYSELKTQLAKQFPFDIEAYCDGKSSFIHAIDKKAGFNGLRTVEALSNDEWQAYHHLKKTLLFNTERHPPYDKNHACFKDVSHYHFVLYQGQEIIGLCHIEMLDEAKAVIRGSAIAKSKQKQGLGGYLLTQMEKWLSHKKIKIIYLHSSPHAIAFYEKKGYQTMPFIDKAIDEKTVDMGKAL